MAGSRTSWNVRPISVHHRRSSPGSSQLTCMGLFLSRGFSCQGAFPVKGLFPVAGQLIADCCLGFAEEFFVRSGKGRSSSRRLRSGSRSARKGSRDRNASAAWRLAALASLVFRSALTPEHAEGRWAGEGPFFEAPVSDGPS